MDGVEDGIYGIINGFMNYGIVDIWIYEYMA